MPCSMNMSLKYFSYRMVGIKYFVIAILGTGFIKRIKEKETQARERGGKAQLFPFCQVF